MEKKTVCDEHDFVFFELKISNNLRECHWDTIAFRWIRFQTRMSPDECAFLYPITYDITLKSLSVSIEKYFAQFGLHTGDKTKTHDTKSDRRQSDETERDDQELPEKSETTSKYGEDEKGYSNTDKRQGDQIWLLIIFLELKI